MIELSLPDMTCGHCASNVVKTCQRVDPHATVDVDLLAHRVTIRSAAEAERFADALAQAGYPPGRWPGPAA